MKIVVAIDSFKGSLSSMQAGRAVQEAAQKVCPEAQVTICPLADGGEGTVDALYTGLGGQMIRLTVTGPRQQPVQAQYCILPNNVAVIEMAAAAGITLLSRDMLDPMETTTYGVGEMIADAVGRGCRSFIIGIGGSATNDGGAGMLKALGYRFVDRDGNDIPLGAKGLASLAHICDEKALPQLKQCNFRVACDVTNPLCGENGCSAVFGPQKGATPQTVALMDQWLQNYAQLSGRLYPRADAQYPGSGAAGGLGFGLRTYLNATLESGIKIILEETGLEAQLQQADLVVTGEGRLDAQTVLGKAPIGVAALAKKYQKKVIAFSGCVTEDACVCNDHGIDAYFPIVRGVTTLDAALNVENAYKNLVSTACQVFRLILIK